MRTIVTRIALVALVVCLPLEAQVSFDRILSAEREPLYRDAATCEIDTRGKSLQMLVDAIVRAMPDAGTPVGVAGRAPS